MHNILTIIKKEFTDILRVRKTLIMTFVVPVVIMPLFFTFVFSNVSDMVSPSEENKDAIILNSTDPSIIALFESNPFYEISEGSGEEAITKAYEGDATLYIDVDDQFQTKLATNQTPTITFYYDTTSQKAQTVAQTSQAMFTQYQTAYVSTILKENGLPEQALAPFDYQTVAKDESVDSFSAMFLGMLIPMMLIGYSVNGISPIAADLGAGEKERGTFEPLLSTSVSRSAVLIGKLVVVSSFGVITSILSAVGIFLALNYGLGDSAFTFSISIPNLLLMIGLTCLYAIFMSAVMLMVSTYARTLKEANTYLTPVALIPIFLSMITMYTDASEIGGMMLHIPILNVVSIIKEIIVNQLNYSHLYIVVGWSAVYVVIAMVLARRMYDKEEIIFRT